MMDRLDKAKKYFGREVGVTKDAKDKINKSLSVLADMSEGMESNGKWSDDSVEEATKAALENCVTYQMQNKIDFLQAKNDALVDSLTELVLLKTHRMAHGKDNYYLENKHRVWVKARKALEENR